ncbi:MAG: phospho-N-acetylmuramoyl-pentapeptide-transferase [Clostridiales bacterium]|nr:phospho-N-acetylmuramoyl-pentapeptide-transferase [Clostridiales bacterium]
MKSSLLALIAAFFLSLIFCKILIPLLRKWKAGQNILSYVKEHKQKSGTPTMGGLAFVTAAIIVSIVVIKEKNIGAILSIIVALAFMLVGVLDDILKQKHKENLGLKAWQKFSFQLLVAIAVGIFCLRNGWTKWYIPFTHAEIDLKNWAMPLLIFIVLASVNAVNLTDGLDGLAAGVGVPFFAFLGLIIWLERGAEGYSVISFSLCGALLAYLFYNASPASVFMGDTGSLALGGFVACLACFSGNALYIAVIGLLFVISVISVVLQVIYYKVTGGKRIFLMSPIHHHFQQKGYSETKIAYAYAAITGLLGIVCVFALI